MTKETCTTFNVSELAEILEVSLTTLHHWIVEGRFTTYTKDHDQEVEIPENAGFHHHDGRIEPLEEIVKRVTNDQNKSFAREDEKILLESEIKILQNKYSGKDLERAITGKFLTSNEESDFSRWRFYHARLQHLL